MSDKELQVRDKQELQTDTEHTRPGPVFIPAVDIFESDDNITLLADMPGVNTDHVSIDLHNGQLTILGEVEPHSSENERLLFKEYETGRFHRAFNLSDTIDQNKISATMKDGVLRLVLPKAEKAKPKSIPVKAG